MPIVSIMYIFFVLYPGYILIICVCGDHDT